MPATPEILQDRRKIRLAEIDHEVKSQQLRRAAGNVAVAAEIAVDLPGESVYAEQGDGQIVRAEIAVECGVGDQAAVIGDDALAEQTLEDSTSRRRMPWSGSMIAATGSAEADATVSVWDLRSGEETD